MILIFAVSYSFLFLGMTQWKPGETEPHSWKEYYRSCPCVPIDYPTIPAAIAAIAQQQQQEEKTPGAIESNKKNPFRRNHATTHNHNNNTNSNQKQHPNRQVRSVRILLRPGTYCLSNTVQIQALPGVVIQLETMEMPIGLFYNNLDRNSNNKARRSSSSSSAMDDILDRPLPAPLPMPSAVSTKRPSFRNLWSCSSNSSRRHRRGGDDDDFPPDDTDYTEDLTDLEDFHHRLPTLPTTSSTATLIQPIARLILRSRRHNEPVFCVRQGILVLKNVEIQHNSHGLDIWNGNAAVQIQPNEPPAFENNPEENGGNNGIHRLRPRPMALLERVQVTSRSGRGIVNIDGGRLCMRQCIVRDCAATGIYIGGPGSAALIESTDVIGNGIGNYPDNATTRHHRRGIARGHSGIYLEQGEAQIRNSTVINNTLTGVSVVSPDNATLQLSQSLLAGNGTFQLELPPTGSASRERCQLNDNTLANESHPMSLQEIVFRSGLTLSSPAVASTTTSAATAITTNPAIGAVMPSVWHQPPQHRPFVEHLL
jgi:hypothetical protein